GKGDVGQGATAVMEDRGDVMERGGYASLVERVWGPFVDQAGQDDLGVARRAVAESILSLSLSLTKQGRLREARWEVERGLRTLLQGEIIPSRVSLREGRGAGLPSR
ncbi:unnamed protein product, partial [Discosporangium mesarthrocarpum]